jgi:hypothetical protein
MGGEERLGSTWIASRFAHTRAELVIVHWAAHYVVEPLNLFYLWRAALTFSPLLPPPASQIGAGALGVPQVQPAAGGLCAVRQPSLALELQPGLPCPPGIAAPPRPRRRCCSEGQQEQQQARGGGGCMRCVVGGGGGGGSAQPSTLTLARSRGAHQALLMRPYFVDWCWNANVLHAGMHDGPPLQGAPLALHRLPGSL